MDQSTTMINRPLITFTSDFGTQSQGIGLMHAVAFSICPGAKLIDLMHGLPPYDTVAAARTLETVRYAPVGQHVCVCDPGVGTDRKGIICHVSRGDYLIGPDNGVLIPATRVLGGIREVRVIANRKLMNEPISPIFHGRDVFAPAAAHLANGVPFEQFGPLLDLTNLTPAAYEEATETDNGLSAHVIQINRFGSVHLNILHEQWDRLRIDLGSIIFVEIPGFPRLSVSFGKTFADVPPHGLIILKDDYGRVEIAKNLASFVAEYSLHIGDKVFLIPPKRP